jgi:hypothetical protein
MCRIASTVEDDLRESRIEIVRDILPVLIFRESIVDAFTKNAWISQQRLWCIHGVVEEEVIVQEVVMPQIIHIFADFRRISAPISIISASISFEWQSEAASIIQMIFLICHCNDVL